MSVASFLSLFVIVGIGADDVFVYTDFWNFSADECTTVRMLKRHPLLIINSPRTGSGRNQEAVVNFRGEPHG